MSRASRLLVFAAAIMVAACTTMPTNQPIGWSAPEVFVAPSSFGGVHGLAIDNQGHLLAGSIVGNSIWEVDRKTGAARVFIGAPDGQADDIAVGPRGELAWTSLLAGELRYRGSDSEPVRVLVKGFPGINSVDFDRRNGKLYVSQTAHTGSADALWEIDRKGDSPPRLIASGIGSLNGFEVGPDGMIYGPLMLRGQVAMIDPASGRVTVIADGFKVPTAANLDGKGGLWVVDARTGELTRVELASGRKTLVKQLKPTLDNLAISPEGTIYVSNAADNSVEAFDPAAGEPRVLTSGKVAIPGGLKVEGNSLWVANVFSLRTVDLSTGAVTDQFRRLRDPELTNFPLSIGLSKTHIALSSWITGTILVIDRATRKVSATISGLKAPYDAIPLADGSVVYAEYGTGSLTLASGAGLGEKRVLASALGGPVQMVLGADGAIYVTESAGKLTRIALDGGTSRTLVDGLASPEGLAQTPWGTFVIAESAARRIIEVDPAAGTRRIVADDLPIGMGGSDSTPAPNVPTGVALGPDGSIYFSADRNNAIYRIRPQR